MALTAPAPTYEKREPIPAGLAVARCYLLADLGIQKINWQGEEKLQRKVQISFELPKHRMEFKRDGDTIEGPCVIGFRLTLSMHAKANLRKNIESWFGKNFPSDDAAASFDLENLVGRPCMINIVHNTKGDDVYANIGSISPLMDGVEAPPAELSPIIFTDGNAETLAKLPKFLQEIVGKQVKDQPLPQETANQAISDPGAQFEDDDSIPF